MENKDLFIGKTVADIEYQENNDVGFCEIVFIFTDKSTAKITTNASSLIYDLFIKEND